MQGKPMLIQWALLLPRKDSGKGKLFWQMVQSNTPHTTFLSCCTKVYPSVSLYQPAILCKQNSKSMLLTMQWGQLLFQLIELYHPKISTTWSSHYFRVRIWQRQKHGDTLSSIKWRASGRWQIWTATKPWEGQRHGEDSVTGCWWKRSHYPR